MREKSAARRVYEHPDVMRLILAELAGKKQVLKMMTLEKSFLPLAIDCLWRPTVLLERYQDWDARIPFHTIYLASVKDIFCDMPMFNALEPVGRGRSVISDYIFPNPDIISDVIEKCPNLRYIRFGSTVNTLDLIEQVEHPEFSIEMLYKYDLRKRRIEIADNLTWAFTDYRRRPFDDIVEHGLRLAWTPVSPCADFEVVHTATVKFTVGPLARGSNHAKRLEDWLASDPIITRLDVSLETEWIPWVANIIRRRKATVNPLTELSFNVTRVSGSEQIENEEERAQRLVNYRAGLAYLVLEMGDSSKTSLKTCVLTSDLLLDLVLRFATKMPKNSSVELQECIFENDSTEPGCLRRVSFDPRISQHFQWHQFIGHNFGSTLRKLDLIPRSIPTEDIHPHPRTPNLHSLDRIVSLIRKEMPVLREMRLALANRGWFCECEMDIADDDWSGTLDFLELVIWDDSAYQDPGRFPMLPILQNVACLTHDRSTLLISSDLEHKPYRKHFEPERCTRMLHWLLGLSPACQDTLMEADLGELWLSPLHVLPISFESLQFDEHDQPIPLSLQFAKNELARLERAASYPAASDKSLRAVEQYRSVLAQR